MESFLKLELHEDITMAILSKFPLEDLQRIQLVSKDWRAWVTSEQVSKKFLSKKAIVLATDTSLWVSHLGSLVKNEEDDSFLERWVVGAEPPIYEVYATGGGFVMIRDFSGGLSLINLRHLKLKIFRKYPLMCGAYALGWNCEGAYTIVEVDSLRKKVSLFDLNTEKRIKSSVAYADDGWRIYLITQEEGFFVDQVFVWVGRVRVEGNAAALYALITFDGATNLFSHIKFTEEWLKDAGLRMSLVSKRTVAMWKPGTTEFIWTYKFDEGKFEKQLLNTYDAATTVEPICFVDDKEETLLSLVDSDTLLFHSCSLHQDKYKPAYQAQFPAIPYFNTDTIQAAWFLDKY